MERRVPIIVTRLSSKYSVVGLPIPRLATSKLVNCRPPPPTQHKLTADWRRVGVGRCELASRHFSQFLTSIQMPTPRACWWQLLAVVTFVHLLICSCVWYLESYSGFTRNVWNALTRPIWTSEKVYYLFGMVYCIRVFHGLGQLMGWVESRFFWFFEWQFSL